MKFKSLVIIVVGLAIAGYIFYPTGYGAISDDAYDLALASYGACLAKSEQRIQQIQIILDDPESLENLTAQEHRWFRDLISKTRSNQWNRAATIAKRMMKDQVTTKF